LTQQQIDNLDAWLRSVLWEATVPCPSNDYGAIDMHRLKGRVIRDDGKTFLIQGVREVFEIFEEPSNGVKTSAGKLVLIGRDLRSGELRRSVEGFVVGNVAVGS